MMMFSTRVNHFTARESVQGRRGGSGRSEAGGENGYRSVLHFHLLQVDLWSQRLKGKSGAPGASRAPAGSGRLGGQRAASTQRGGLLCAHFQLNGCRSSLKLK